MLNAFRQDLSFAVRTLRRRRSFAAVAITTMALAVGATTSIYSAVDGVLFRPFPYPDPERIVAAWQTYPFWLKEPILSASWDRISLSIPEFRDWRAGQHSFVDVAIWNTGSSMLGGSETPEVVTVRHASPSLLRVLGLSPTLGRNFLEEEDVVGGPRVAMMTYEAWQSRYGGNPGVIGSSVRLDDVAYTVVGVLPQQLRMPLGRARVAAPFWTPVGQDSLDARSRNNHSYFAIGRLKAGVSIAAATTEMDHILRNGELPDRKGFRMAEWQSDQTRDVRSPLLVLFAAVGVLLLIASVNTAVLLLGEASAREAEIASRIALGAGRVRIVRQVLTESIVLGTLGGVFGVLLAWGGTRSLVALAPQGIPGLTTVHVDGRVLAFSLAVTLGTGLLFGLAPAFALGRSSPADVLRRGAGQSRGGRSGMQRILVGVEIALSLVLLVSAGLLGRSLDRLSAVDAGFRSDHLLVVNTTLPRSMSRDSFALRAFYRNAEERLASLPGVVAVASTTTVPFGGGSSSTTIEIEGRAPGTVFSGSEVQQRMVTPRYFSTLGVPLVAGRLLDDRDRAGSPLVLVVSQSMATRDFPNESAIGKRVRFQGAWREIVGIVRDIRYSKLSSDVQATVYAPLEQRSFSGGSFILRTAGEPLELTSAIRRVLADIAPQSAFQSAEPMTALIARSYADERFRTTLITLFGVLAGLLAAVGMYGVTSRAVARRTRELGIRMALGATAGGVVRLVVTGTLGGLALGLAAGLLGAVGAGKFLAPYLFQVSPSDPMSYSGGAAVLVLASLVASWLPARRAASVAPSVVLRND